MREFTVQIQKLPLGILFAPPSGYNNFITIIGVSNHSHGAELGLSIGDVLVAINGRKTDTLSPFGSLQLFNQQRPPFSATFRTFTKHIPLTYIHTDMKPEWIHKPKNVAPTAFTIAPQLSVTEDCDINDDHYICSTDADTPDIPYFDDINSFECPSLLDTPSTRITRAKSTPFDLEYTDPMSMSIISPKSTATQIYSYLNFYDNYVDIFTKDLVNGYIHILDQQRATNEDSVGTQMCAVLEIISIICAQYVFDNSIKFDYIKQSIPPPPSWTAANPRSLYDFASTDSECNINTNDHGLATVCKISSHGLKYGYHEWSVKIIKCQGAIRQEIGVVSNPDFDEDEILTFEDGVKNTFEFGARAIYGMKKISVHDKDPVFYNYYASRHSMRAKWKKKRMRRLKRKRKRRKERA